MSGNENAFNCPIKNFSFTYFSKCFSKIIREKSVQHWVDA